jgi:hypothetical protein
VPLGDHIYADIQDSMIFRLANSVGSMREHGRAIDIGGHAPQFATCASRVEHVEHGRPVDAGRHTPQFLTPHFREEYEEYEEYGRPTDPGRQKGKRGGARVIDLNLPEIDRIVLITVYGKDQNDDLTPADKAHYRQLVQVLKQQARRHSAGDRRGHR